MLSAILNTKQCNILVLCTAIIRYTAMDFSMYGICITVVLGFVDNNIGVLDELRLSHYKVLPVIQQRLYYKTGIIEEEEEA